MNNLIIPKGYKSGLSLIETQVAIKTIKDLFEKELSRQLNITRVSAPLFVLPETGLNDNLSGVERPVTFGIADLNGHRAEVVQSLAKWKRNALKEYGFKPQEGIYTDMNAIRRDEELGNIHSLYVDQWDWEKVITKNDRSDQYLEETVKAIYRALKITEDYIVYEYDYIDRLLPNEITFVSAQQLEDKYPNMTSKEREYEISKKHGAVFIKQIGDKLLSGDIHDKRAPDYDDWQLNGDIIFYYPVLDIALEISSMGIRVDAKSMETQLKKSNNMERAILPYQKAILNDEMPLTIGGGIGQSRICMFFLRKAHIGEIQASIWSKSTRSKAKEHGIYLL